MHKLYSTTDLAFLELLKSKLKDEGIACIIKNAHPPAAGEITPIIAWPELWVIDDDYYPKAKKIIQADLMQLSEKGENWECPTCGEWLDGQFNVCWNCGTSKS